MCAIFGCHQRNNKNFRSDRILGGQSDTVKRWNEIQFLPLAEQQMLDELTHGLVKPKSLDWIVRLIVAHQKAESK